jgi:hypothetical protein
MPIALWPPPLPGRIFAGVFFLCLYAFVAWLIWGAVRDWRREHGTSVRLADQGHGADRLEML